MSKESEIIKQIEEGIRLKEFLKTQASLLIDIADYIVQALKAGNKVLLFGNGGSAADAQHIAAELAGKFYLDRSPLPAYALTTNTSVLTAIANDYDFETIFSRQVRGLVKAGDIVIGISTSGNSPNVIRGIEEAKRLGARTIVLTSQDGVLKSLADYALTVPSADTARIQEVHITMGHIICYLVEQALFAKGKE